MPLRFVIRVLYRACILVGYGVFLIEPGAQVNELAAFAAERSRPGRRGPLNGSAAAGTVGYYTFLIHDSTQRQQERYIGIRVQGSTVDV